MEQNDNDLVKNLISLIDETISEVEEIKKSKFAASEITLGDSEGLAGKSKNGELDAKKKEEEDEDDEDEDDVEKGENEKADEDHGKFAQSSSVSKGEDEEEDEEDEEDEDKKKKKEEKFMKKSLGESESLMKSYVDQKMSTIEDRLIEITEIIEAIADSPVERRGIPSGITALHKSQDEIEPMSKAEIADALFELKKSGESVDSADIFTAETGSQHTANQIASKYGLK